MNIPILVIGVGFDGNEINLLDIVDDVDYWKTYKLQDFNEIIAEYPELYKDRDLH